jgi:hypothetical protein
LVFAQHDAVGVVDKEALHVGAGAVGSGVVFGPVGLADFAEVAALVMSVVGADAGAWGAGATRTAWMSQARANYERPALIFIKAAHVLFLCVFSAFNVCLLDLVPRLGAGVHRGGVTFKLSRLASMLVC